MDNMTPRDIAHWNFEADDESVLVCKGQHEKHEFCEAHMERLCPHDVLKIINELQSRYLAIEEKIRGVSS